jgi:hypothetical protein
MCTTYRFASVVVKSAPPPSAPPAKMQHGSDASLQRQRFLAKHHRSVLDMQRKAGGRDGALTMSDVSAPPKALESLPGAAKATSTAPPLDSKSAAATPPLPYSNEQLSAMQTSKSALTTPVTAGAGAAAGDVNGNGMRVSATSCKLCLFACFHFVLLRTVITNISRFDRYMMRLHPCIYKRVSLDKPFTF